MKKAIFILGLVALVWSCSDDDPPQNNDDNNNTVELCDTLGGATYDEDIASILTSSCAPCHTTSASAGVNVATYADAKASAQDPKFLKSIKHESGVSPMPQGGSKLSDEDIQSIECWIVNGYPEN